MDIRVKPALVGQLNGKPAAAAASAAPQTERPPVYAETIQDDFRVQADIYDTSRTVGNKLSGAVTGIAGHVGGNAALVLPAVGETYKNLWKAETIGKYAKGVGSIIALAGIPIVAAGALIASPFQGIAEAFKDESPRDKRLVQDTSGKVAERITSKEDGPATILGRSIESMREFGNEKLAPGEEPWDIPIDKIAHVMVKVPVALYQGTKKVAIEAGKAAKKVAVATKDFTKEYAPKLAGAALAGTVSAMISGPAGLVIGTGVGLALAGRDIKESVVGEDRGVGEFAKAVAKTPAYALAGPVMAFKSTKANFGRGFSEGWNGKPVEAIKTTGKALMAQAKEALNVNKENN